MTWRTKEDLGLEQVALVHEHLKVEEQWSVDIDRGFMWWAEDFCQKVWADLGMFQSARNIFRLHVETELLRGRGRAQNFDLALAQEMKDARLSAVCFDPDRDMFVLHTSLYLTGDDLEWLPRLFLTAAALQVDEAHVIGHDLAQTLHATPAASGHPSHGLRSSPAPVLGVIEKNFKPHGSQPSRWEDSAEWKETEWAMDRQASSFESDHRTHLTAYFPWPLSDGAVSLSITTDAPHPQLGNGLNMVLRLPLDMSPEKCAHTAMALNNLERKEWLRCQMLGSWGFDEGKLQFECFVPNVAHHDGVLMNLALSMSIRAQWVADQFAIWFQAAR